MTNTILTLTSEMGELRYKGKTLSPYERFQQAFVAVLTLVIAVIVTVSTWQLLLHPLRLFESHVVTPADSHVFQSLFGMVLTVLIALQFKHTLLDLVRRFIILTLYQTRPGVIAALAGAALALGLV